MKLTTKDYVVLVIREIVRISLREKWNLCTHHGYIYLYNNEFWDKIDEKSFQQFLGEAAIKMGINDIKAEHYKFQEELFKQFLSRSWLPAPLPDPNKVMVNLKNGTLHIYTDGKSGKLVCKLKNFNAADFMTYQLNFDYKPKAIANEFNKFIDYILPDEESQQLLAEYIGYCFVRTNNKKLKLQKVLILYGTGSNGKSTFQEILKGIFPKQSFTEFSLAELNDTSGYYRAMIKDALLNYCGEWNGKMTPDIFKKMASGETITIRLPYGKPDNIECYARLIFNSNEYPELCENTPAMHRRFLIIPFTKHIPEAKQNPGLSEKILSSDEEKSGILNWILNIGLKTLLANGKFSKCKASEDATKEFQIQSDTTLLFMNDEGLVPSLESAYLQKDLYAEYKSFCINNGLRPLSSRKFGERLRNIGIEDERRGAGNIFYIERKTNATL